MDYMSFDCGTLPASVHISRFKGSGGVDEYHLTVRPTEVGSIDAHLEWVESAYRSALDSLGLDSQTALVRRLFCSDLPNQVDVLEACPCSSRSNPDEPCAVSWVCQPPVPTAKIVLWAYHVSDRNGALHKTRENGSLVLRRGELAHQWTTGITSPNGDTTYAQTHGVFEAYDSMLRARDLSMADNVMRTWLYVQNIDANYRGMVVARREFFAEHGLTQDTHFIASSGIQGTSANAADRVAMDAYAISGVRPEQIEYLAALDHLAPTYDYGVTFERATSISYRDRTHVILSGTASIDPRGDILYPGEVSRQLDRTLENMEALLSQAGATLEDMCTFIVYVRDPSDHVCAWQRMQERFGDAPIEVLVASVCRPGWLIEVEGTAIVPASNPELPAF
jgi:enamine deaminase RidA (YjgF/YER057c/UK114 family)